MGRFSCFSNHDLGLAIPVEVGGSHGARFGFERDGSGKGQAPVVKGCFSQRFFGFTEQEELAASIAVHVAGRERGDRGVSRVTLGRGKAALVVLKEDPDPCTFAVARSHIRLPIAVDISHREPSLASIDIGDSIGMASRRSSSGSTIHVSLSERNAASERMWLRPHAPAPATATRINRPAPWTGNGSALR